MRIERISVVIPIYNEEDNINKLYLSLKDALSPLNLAYEIIYVNDGSTDNSETIIKGICSNDLNTKLINFNKNYGQDAALAAGLRQARGEAIISMDGDLQDDPRDIKLFIERIDNGCDIVCGWRKNRAKRNIIRQILAFLGNKLGKIIFKLPFHDFNATFKAYRRDVINEFYFFKGFHRFVPLLASLKHLRAEELVIRNNPRQSGHSKYPIFGLRRIFEVALDTILLYYAIFFMNKQLDRVLPKAYYEISEKYGYRQEGKAKRGDEFFEEGIYYNTNV